MGVNFCLRRIQQYSNHNNYSIMKAPPVLMPRWRYVPKVHDIKLLIASFYTHIDIIMLNIFNFAACRIQNHNETQRVGNDRPWLLLKTISSSLKLMAASQQSLAALFSLLQLPIASNTRWTSFATDSSEKDAMAFQVSKPRHNSRTKLYFANP